MVDGKENNPTFALLRDVLNGLFTHGGQSIANAAKHSEWSASAWTHTIDYLEARAMLTKEKTGRCVKVTLTPQGLKVRDAANALYDLLEGGKTKWETVPNQDVTSQRRGATRFVTRIGKQSSKAPRKPQSLPRKRGTTTRK